MSYVQLKIKLAPLKLIDQLKGKFTMNTAKLLAMYLSVFEC